MAADILKLIFCLAAFCVVLWGAYTVSKWMATRSAMGMSSRFMKIADRIPLSKDSSLCIAEIGGKYFLIGISAGNISLLSELCEEDLTPVQDTAEILNPVYAVRDAVLKFIPKRQNNNLSDKNNMDFHAFLKRHIDKPEDEDTELIDKIIDESRKNTERFTRKKSGEDGNDES